MKKIPVVLFASLLFVACNSEQKTEEKEVEEVAVDPNAKLDPVCDMVKGDDWTEYTANDTDTTWFCSEVCKGVYNANPDKYNKG